MYQWEINYQLAVVRPDVLLLVGFVTELHPADLALCPLVRVQVVHLRKPLPAGAAFVGICFEWHGIHGESQFLKLCSVWPALSSFHVSVLFMSWSKMLTAATGRFRWCFVLPNRLLFQARSI